MYARTHAPLHEDSGWILSPGYADTAKAHPAFCHIPSLMTSQASGFHHLAKLTQLKRLNLYNTSITGDALMPVFSTATTLE
jgi:hypothetical protein